MCALSAVHGTQYGDLEHSDDQRFNVNKMSYAPNTATDKKKNENASGNENGSNGKKNMLDENWQNHVGKCSRIFVIVVRSRSYIGLLHAHSMSFNVLFRIYCMLPGNFNQCSIVNDPSTEMAKFKNPNFPFTCLPDENWNEINEFNFFVFVHKWQMDKCNIKQATSLYFCISIQFKI